jgi:hypothetical protein
MIASAAFACALNLGTSAARRGSVTERTWRRSAGSASSQPDTGRAAVAGIPGVLILRLITSPVRTERVRCTDIDLAPPDRSPASRSRKESSIRDQNTQVPGSRHRLATALPREGGLGRRHNNRPKGQGSKSNLVGPTPHSRDRPKLGLAPRGLVQLEFDKVRPVHSRPRRSRLTPSRSFRA